MPHPSLRPAIAVPHLGFICLSLVVVLLTSGFVWPAHADMSFHTVYARSDHNAQTLGGINNIIQDPQGFMWFGGDTGLGRFDGRNTRLYKADPNNPYALPHSFVRDLLVDQDGVLWVATDRGLCRYQARMDRFICNEAFGANQLPPLSVRALAVDAQNNIFVGGEAGFFKITADRQELLPLTLKQPNMTTSPLVLSIAVEGTTLWLATDSHGLIRLELADHSLRYYRAEDATPTGLSHNRTQALALDAQNRLWIATYGGGVSVLNADRDAFEHHLAEPNNRYSLGSNVIWDVFVDQFGTIWLAVDQGGLVRFDEQRQGFIAYRHKPYDTGSLPSDQVRSVYEDRNGDLWVGSFPYGVSYFNRATAHIRNYQHEPDNPQSISHSSVLTIKRDARGQIWVGTEDGLNLFNPAEGHFTRFQFGRNTALTAKAVLSIEQFDERTLWVGTWSGGLLAFDLDTHQFSPIDTTPLTEGSQNSRFIWDILRDKDNNIWLATEFNGIAFYDRLTQTFRYYKYDPNDPHSLPGNFARTIHQDGQGRLWFGTYSGLARMSAQGQPLERIEADPTNSQALASDRIVGLFEDSQGRIWMASRDSGFFVYDPTSSTYRPIGTAQGLPSPTTSGAIEDLQGNIWLLTFNGLVKIDPSNWNLRVFGTENGLVGNNFNRDGSLLMEDGRLLLGGADGLSLFDPDQLIVEVPKFELYLTAFKVMNREVRPGGEDGLLQESIVFAERIDLNHIHLMFSFEFAALNYRNLSDTRYTYKLEGFDKAWHDIGNQFSATYTNIGPGNYRFRVRATSGDGPFREAERTIVLRLQPALWQTPWAYGVYFGLMGLLGALLINYLRLHLRSKLLQILSTTDALTGLTNRLGLSQMAEKRFAGRDTHNSLCLLFIDIDHFKSINDQRGHDSGDRILIEVAQVFRTCIRQSDLLGRWGGEEFLLVCSGLDQAGGLKVAEKIRSQIAAQTYDHDHQQPIIVTVSIGVAAVQPNETFESAFKRADQALYQAKAQGRNCTIGAS